MELSKEDREELIRYAKALINFSATVTLHKRNITAILSGKLPPMKVELLIQRIERQDRTAGQQLKESYKRLIDAAVDKKFSLKSPKELMTLFPSSESIGKIKYEANQLAALMQEIVKESPVKDKRTSAGHGKPIQTSGKAGKIEYSLPLFMKQWAYVFDVSANKMRELREGDHYHFRKVSPRKWTLPKGELPAEYLEKFRSVIPKNQPKKQ